VVQIGRGRPMDLHVRRSGHGELVRGVDHVRGEGGGLLGMEVVGDRVHEAGEGPLRMEVVGHEARMGQPRVPLRESRWAGPELRALGPAVEREVHGGHELRVFHHGAGTAGKATDPKGCRSIRLFRSRGCRRRQGD
jgi:hypothetical protein